MKKPYYDNDYGKYNPDKYNLESDEFGVVFVFVFIIFVMLITYLIFVL